MVVWHDAADDMNALDARREEMTLDQLLRLAMVKALVSIGQELSMIHHGGVNPEYDPNN